MAADVGTVPGLRGLLNAVVQCGLASATAAAAGARKEATLDEQMGSIGAAHSRKGPYGRSLSWISQLSALPVAVGVFGRQRAGPIPAPSDYAPADVKGGGQNQASLPVVRRGWTDVLLRAYRGISDDRMLLVAAGVTFYAILALFPGIGAIVSIYGLFADPSTIVAHLDTLSGFAPGGAVDVLREQLTRLAHQDKTALGFGFAVSLMIGMWSANAGVSALFEALTTVYEEHEKRGLIKYYATTLAFTAGAIVIVQLLLAILIALPLILDHIPNPGSTAVVLKIIRWPILLVLVATALSVVYRYGPSRNARPWRWITWGSAFAAVTWLAASALFSWYVANFGSYNKTYGSLGAIIGFMTWMWVSLIVVLVGAKLDDELERRSPPSARNLPKPRMQSAPHANEQGN
jgi:membrane protein